MPLIEEVFKASEGVVVDALEKGAGADCGDIESDAPELLAHVRALLDEFNAVDGAAELRLVLEGGAARIEGAQTFDAVNAAQRTVREVATAMCDIGVRTSELAAIVYAEDSLDEHTVSLVWKYLMSMPASLPTAIAPSTMCVIAGDSTVRPAIHCAGENSLRYRVEDQLFTRQTLEHSRTDIEASLRGSDADMPLFPLFLAAGASMADGLPSGDSLRDKALSRLTGIQVDRTSFVEVSSNWYAQLERRGELEDWELEAGQKAFVDSLTLERVLEHEQRAEGNANSQTLREFRRQHDQRYDELVAARHAGELDDDPIARLCRRRSRIVLVTVNFDRFVEARADDDVRPYVTPEELERFPSELEEYKDSGGPIPLLKLHGSIENAESLVASISETTSGLTLLRQTAIQALVTAIDRQETHPWWYVGYSMRDRDLETIWRGSEFPRFNERWVAPFLDPNVEAFIKQFRMSKWHGQNYATRRSAQERLVSLTAQEFLRELADLVDKHWS